MNSGLRNTTMSIQRISFDSVGKISIKLEDGREFIIPLKYFPEIKRMPLEKRKKYTIVDDRTVLFKHSDSIYHLEDFIGLEGMWRAR